MFWSESSPCSRSASGFVGGLSVQNAALLKLLVLVALYRFTVRVVFVPLFVLSLLCLFRTVADVFFVLSWLLQWTWTCDDVF